MKSNLTVFSDSHNDLFAVKRLTGDFLSSNYIFYLGDGIYDIKDCYFEYPNKFFAVEGNCDGFSLGTSEIITEIDGVKILAVHGHKFLVKSGLDRLVNYAKQKNCRLVLYGHTHRPMVSEIDGITLVNPGTISLHGNSRTFCRITLNDKTITAKIIPLKF